VRADRSRKNQQPEISGEKTTCSGHLVKKDCGFWGIARKWVNAAGHRRIMRPYTLTRAVLRWGGGQRQFSSLHILGYRKLWSGESCQRSAKSANSPMTIS
jgi:hypothetical protein